MPAETLVHVLRDNYTDSKVRGKKSFLLERQQLYSLAEFRSQTEILGFLADGPYGPELSRLQEASTPVETERAVRLGFARAVKNLMATAKGSVSEFLLEYCRRFDAYDLAAVVIYKAQGKTWEEYVGTRQPLAVMKDKELHRLYSAEDPDEMVSAIGDEALESRLSGIDLEELTPDKASLIRDVFNGWGEERFCNYIAEKLHGRDRKSCLPIVGSNIDLLNVSITLRSKLIGLHDVQAHLVPVNWKIEQKSMGELVSAEDLTLALDQAANLRHYRKMLAGAKQRYDESKSLSFIEVAVRNRLVDTSRKVLLDFPHTIGVVLAFLVLKENEARSLAAIIAGVGAGLRPDQIRPLIIA